MKNYYTDITLDDALQRINIWSPVLIYYNDFIVWDDENTIFGVDWIPYADAIQNFKNNNTDWQKIRITTIDIEIVQFHHSIIHLKGYKI